MRILLINIIIIFWGFSTTAQIVLDPAPTTMFCGGENLTIGGAASCEDNGGVSAGFVWDVILDVELLNTEFVIDDCFMFSPPPVIVAGNTAWGLDVDCTSVDPNGVDAANANPGYMAFAFDLDCNDTFEFPVPVNESCAPVTVTIGYAIEYDYTVYPPGTCGFNGVGAYTGNVFPITVTIAPFYNVAQFVDYSGACGNQAYAIGIDNACQGNEDGDIAAPTLGQIDDCGGPDGTPDFDDPEVCLTLTATIDAGALVPANPACITAVPYTSAEDLNGDFFWDASEIAAAAGLPVEAAACYASFEQSYSASADCLPPLLPPTLDYSLEETLVCAGGEVTLLAGGTCAGYNGTIDTDGNGFIDAVGDCVSWDLDIFVSTDALNAVPECSAIMNPQPGPPVYAFGDDFGSIVDQGYTYLGTLNDCIDGDINLPVNLTCDPIDLDIYLLSWNWSIESDIVPGDLICDLGGYDPAVPPVTLTTTILPFLSAAATVDYTPACGKFELVLGYDCDGDGDLNSADFLDADDCGGEMTATSDWDAGDICPNTTFTAIPDLFVLTPANPACYVDVPLNSPQDIDGDGDWDGIDIANLFGYAPGSPENAIAASCYDFFTTSYPATTSCLQPLAPPTCDFVTPVEICDGGNVIIATGPACAGYDGVIDVDGDGFISSPNDKVSWDADFYISDDLINNPNPGPPVITGPVTSFTDVTDQGYIYVGTSNNCDAIDIGTFFNGTCVPFDFEVYVVSWNWGYESDDTPMDGICNLGGYTPDGPGCTIPVIVNPIFEIIEDATNGCNPIAGVFASDGAGGFYDQDGDGALTFADACMTDELAANCTDGATLTYDFDALNAGECSGDLTGTLTCNCPPQVCEDYNAITVAAGCNVFDICIGYVDENQDGLSDVGGTDPTGAVMTIDFGAATGGTFVNNGIFAFDADGDMILDATGFCVTYQFDPQGCDPIPSPNIVTLTCNDGTASNIDLGDGPIPITNADIVGDVFGVSGGQSFYPVLSTNVTAATCPTLPDESDAVAASVDIVAPNGTICSTITGDLPGCSMAGGNASTPVQANPIADPLLSALFGAGSFICGLDITADLSFDCPSCGCPVALTPPANANGCDSDGTGFDFPLDLAACTGADGPVGAGFVFDIYVYDDGTTNEAPVGYENTVIPVSAEFPDPFGDGIVRPIERDQTCSDAVGTFNVTNTTCEPSTFTLLYFPFDYTLDADGDLVAEYPPDCQPVRVDYTVYPTLRAVVATDASASCGDVVFNLESPDATVCATQTIACAADGEMPSVTFPPVTNENPDGTCNSYMATGGTCVGCVMPICNAMAGDAIIANLVVCPDDAGTLQLSTLFDPATGGFDVDGDGTIDDPVVTNYYAVDAGGNIISVSDFEATIDLSMVASGETAKVYQLAYTQGLLDDITMFIDENICGLDPTGTIDAAIGCPLSPAELAPVLDGLNNAFGPLSNQFVCDFIENQVLNLGPDPTCVTIIGASVCLLDGILPGDPGGDEMLTIDLMALGLAICADKSDVPLCIEIFECEYTCPADEEVECIVDFVAGNVSIGSCGDSTPTISNEDPVISNDGIANCPGTTYDVVYSVMDQCETTTCTQVVTIDNAAPTITCPANETVDCIADVVLNKCTFTVSCGLGNTVTETGPTLVSGIADCDGAVYEVTCMIEDDCGRAADCTYTITIVNDGPTITCPTGNTVECVEDIAIGVPTVVFSCGLNVDITTTSPMLATGTANCDEATYEVIYTATDDCGRTASCTATWTLDNAPPTISCPSNVDLETCMVSEITASGTLGFPFSDTPVVITGAQFTAEGGSYTVSCESTSTIAYQDSFDTCPYDINRVYTITDACGRTVSCTQWITLEDCAVACKGQINMSLDENCVGTVVPAMMINPVQFPRDYYDITITDHHGNVVDNQFDFNDIGETFDVSIGLIGCPDMISCWGTMTVEDKFPPVLICEPDTFYIPCHALINIAEPEAVENCSEYDVILIDEVIESFECDSLYTGIIKRTYTAVDAAGNSSVVPCTQVIYLERTNLDNVMCPTHTVLQCNSYPLDDNGHPLPYEVSTGSGSGTPFIPEIDEITGTITGSGFGLIPGPQELICNTFVEYTDQVFETNDCTTKIYRYWSIREWWCEGETVTGCQQVIEITDTIAPVIKCPEDMTVTVNAGYDECLTKVNLPGLKGVDDCQGPISVTIEYANGVIEGNGGYAELPVGDNIVTYHAFDNCYNRSSCTVKVTVFDDTNPVAICDQNTVVSIPSGGLLEVWAETFDDGSFDECGIHEYLVRRMDSFCDTLEQDLEFGESVNFCCEDVGQSIMVVFRVVDYSGNFNDCMVNVNVQDKTIPQLICPDDVTIYCDEPYDLDNLDIFFGEIEVNDNCTNVPVEETVDVDIDQCGVGTIIREFSLTVNSGGVNETVTCVQEITVAYKDQMFYEDIIWPEDAEVNVACANPSAADPETLPEGMDRPTITEGICDLVGFNYEDEIFDFVAGGQACLKIVRHWQVINWCQRVDGEFIIWDHYQEIKLNNNVAPEINPNCESPIIISSVDIDCSPVPVFIELDVQDDCTEVDNLQIEWTINVNNDDDTTNDISGTGSISESIPVGDHTISWEARDKCGNVSFCTQPLKIVNDKSPNAICIHGLSVEIVGMDTDDDGMPDTEMAILWASDFDGGSNHPCGYDVTFSFSADPEDIFLNIECQIGEVPVELWVTDENGNTSICETFVLVTNNVDEELCGLVGPFDPTGGDDEGDGPTGPGDGETGDGPEVNISGRIATDSDVVVTDSEVHLMGTSLMEMTDNYGQYMFEGMPVGGSYEVTPHKNDNPLNGVSTLDIILIQRHVLGLESLTSPYQYIAADANGSNSLSAIDLVEIRKLILGVNDNFLDNTSWRFVQKDFVFTDEDPYNQQFAENYNIFDLTTDMVLDFVGIKVGDVNGSVVSSLNGDTVESRSSKTLQLEYELLNSVDGTSIMVSSAENTTVNGFQLSMNIGSIQIESISSQLENFNDSNFFIHSDGTLTMSWHGSKAISLSSDTALFTIHSQNKIISTKGIDINSSITSAEAYDDSDQIMEIELTQKLSSDVYVLNQNQPNPWLDKTVIKYELPVKSNVTFRFSDVNGRILYKVSTLGNIGENELEVDRSNIPASGVIYYEMQIGEERLLKKMILLH